MQFIYPSFLFALAAVAIPIVIHLFKFRKYKKEYFSNVALLRQIQVEYKKQSKLKERLILSARILTIVCLVLAFAQPYWSSNTGKKTISSQRYVSIYLDNSYSMEASSGNGILLDMGKEQVKRILQSLEPNSKVQLLTNDFKGEEQRFLSTKEIMDLLPDIEVSPKPRTFAQIRQRQNSLCEQVSLASENRLYYYISDFQKATFDLPQKNGLFEKDKDSAIYSVFVPLDAVDYANLSIDSLFLGSPVLQVNRPMELKIKIKNTGGKDRKKISVKLFLDQKQISVTSVDILAKESKEVSMPLLLTKSGNYQGYVEIVDYPMLYDNRLYFSFSVGTSVSILHIYDDTPCLSIPKLFQGDSAFDYKGISLNQLNYALIPSAQWIILDAVKSTSSALEEALLHFVQRGGSLTLLPPLPESNVDLPLPYARLTNRLIGGTYARFVSRLEEVHSINIQHPIFNLALEKYASISILPKTKGYYPLPVVSKVSSESLMSFANALSNSAKMDFMRIYYVDRGLLYCLSTPLDLDYSDFVSQYSFVISFLNMAFYTGGSKALYASTGTEDGIYLPGFTDGTFWEKDMEKLEIRAVDGDFACIPEIRNIGSEIGLFTHGQIRHAGNYYLVDGEKKKKAVLSFNDERVESLPDCYTEKELKRWMSSLENQNFYLVNPAKVDLQKAVERMTMGVELWKFLLIFALVFILMEIILISWSKGRFTLQKPQK